MAKCRLIILAIFLSTLLSCGGGGGSSVACTPGTSSFIYEVSQSLSCANTSNGNLKSTVDFSGTYGVADGGGGGGDGGGGGGGAGAGDLLIRISRLFKDVFLALQGISNAQAQTITACGAGVSQSDLNRLTDTGWVYQPMVKSGTAAGTACVKRIFDANKYIAVYATGLTKFDQICYLVMVKKSDGSTHCFSSTVSLSLEDENLLTPPTANYLDYMSPSLKSSPSMSLTANKTYFGVLFRTDTYRQRMVRFDVSSSTAVPYAVVFDSDSIKDAAPWNGAGNQKFGKQFLLNNGKSVLHYFNGASNADTTSSGYTYLSDESTVSSPVTINNNLYWNPQCVIQNGSDDSSFVGIFKTYNPSGNNYFNQLIRSSSTTTTQISNLTGISCDGGAATVGNRFYYLTNNSYGTPARNGYNAKYLLTDLSATNSLAQSAIQAFAIDPIAGNCSSYTFLGTTNSGLYEASMFLDASNNFNVAVRTRTIFDSNGRLSTLSAGAVGLSAVLRFDASHNAIPYPNADTTLNIPFSKCLTIRKFEKASSGNFAVLTEPLGSGSVVSQITSIYDSNSNLTFTPSAGPATTNLLTKLGAMLNPL
jgi:hypothetical protein